MSECSPARSSPPQHLDRKDPRRNNVVCVPGCSRLPAAAARAEGPVVKNSVDSGLLAGEAGGIEEGRTRRSGACTGSGLPLGSQPGRGEPQQERTRPAWIAGRTFPADRHTQQKTLGNSRTRSRSRLCGFPQKQASVAAPYPVPICNFQFPPCVQRADNRGLPCGKVQRFRPPYRGLLFQPCVRAATGWFAWGCLP